jgi:glycosyl transferase family 25
MLKGYYINLDHRIDRMNHFEELKKKYSFFKNTERISAIMNKNGAIGCGMSHIKVLKKFLEMDDDIFLVCEDDLTILNNTNYEKFVDDFNNIKNDDWDIIVLTPRGDRYESTLGNNFHRIICNQTTTGYIIKKTFIPTLIDNLKAAIVGLINNLDPNTYAIDQYWKRLQKDYNFYYYENIFAGQLVGFSDIENRQVNYNERYIQQK